MFKKLISGTLVLLIVFFAFTQPAKTLGVATSVFGDLHSAANSVKHFANHH